METVSYVNEVVINGFSIGAATGIIAFFTAWIPCTIFKLINRTI